MSSVNNFDSADLTPFLNEQCPFYRDLNKIFGMIFEKQFW